MGAWHGCVRRPEKGIDRTHERRGTTRAGGDMRWAAGRRARPTTFAFLVS